MQERWCASGDSRLLRIFGIYVNGDAGFSRYVGVSAFEGDNLNQVEVGSQHQWVRRLSATATETVFVTDFTESVEYT